MKALLILINWHSPTNQVFGASNRVRRMPLLYNDIIEIERQVILDHSILLVIHSPSATQGVSKFCFTKCRKKLFFCAQRAEQAWLRCCYHFIGLCGSRWLMQSIFCLAKAHRAIWMIKKNKADKKNLYFFSLLRSRSNSAGEKNNPWLNEAFIWLTKTIGNRGLGP